jgi:hypothetical protein
MLGRFRLGRGGNKVMAKIKEQAVLEAKVHLLIA